MKMKNWRLNLDKAAICLAVLYVVLPIVIFGFGWLKLPYAIILGVILAGLAYKLFETLCENETQLFTKDSVKYWLIVIGVCMLWVYFSGIGGFCFQNKDFWARNPIYRDLSTYQWPVIYDLSQEPEAIQKVVSSDHVSLSYYFAWWLVPALLSKIFHMGDAMRNIVLYGWALLGVFLVLYCINRLLKRYSYLAVFVFIFFSGLDVVMFTLRQQRINFTDEMEWWADYFQYSANNTQLFFVFNQSIPIWLITALVLLLMKNNKYIAGIASLSMAYSPWATFGMVPIALAGTFGKDKKLKDMLNPFNILAPLAMLIVYGSFYMASNGSDGGFGLIFSKYPNQTHQILCTYIVFVFIEVGAYFCVMGSQIKKYPYYWVVLIELIIFPLFYFRDKNFVMRGTIPALFILTVFVIKYMLEPATENEHKIRKRIMVVLLILGMMTPLTDLNRTMFKTIDNSNIIEDDVYSFGNMQTDNEEHIEKSKTQFFVYEYEDTFFFKYLAK